MARIVVELTNRCNLRCQHCFDERHAATGDLPLEILQKVLREGKSCGIDQVSFTGGEPTIHRQFHEIIRCVCEAGYVFSFVSNGVNFPQIYPLLLTHRNWFRGVTFSLDGAREKTHNRLRGKGSYRRVMRAASICVFKEIPFTLNMVLTAQNRNEVNEMIWLAGRLGSGGLRFGHLMPTPETALRHLDLSPQERREVEAEIWRLQKGASIPIGMASGYFSESPFFPCGPLELEEFNLDYRGNLTLCCHLSGYSGANQEPDVMGNLLEVSLAEACGRFRQQVAKYLADKHDTISRGEFTELDHFPCWYCVKYLGKVPLLKDFPHHPWVQVSHHAGAGRSTFIVDQKIRLHREVVDT
jgi:MoaA/NifB/PqqE/SkfB family radical SAM enzyme